MSYRRESDEPKPKRKTQKWEDETWGQAEKKECKDAWLRCIIAILIFAALIIGAYCIDEVNEVNEPSLREPDGYILVYVDINDFWSCNPWGYISEEDYQKFLDGELKGNLRIEHPYDEGKCMVVSVGIIESIVTGDVSGVDW